jgi:hypothetical protein
MSSGLWISIMDLMNHMIGALDEIFVGAIFFGIYFDGNLVVEALLIV